MFLSITHRGENATDPGQLLHKHPARLHETDLGFGTALNARCTMRPELLDQALGLEALTRFTARRPLREVHSCIPGVLALESEPVDPRL